jgi:hypothetical protein
VAALPGYRYHLVQVAGFAGQPAGGNKEGTVAAIHVRRAFNLKFIQPPRVIESSGSSVMD